MPRSNETTDPKHNSKSSYLLYFESKRINKLSKKVIWNRFMLYRDVSLP